MPKRKNCANFARGLGEWKPRRGAVDVRPDCRWLRVRLVRLRYGRRHLFSILFSRAFARNRNMCRIARIFALLRTYLLVITSTYVIFFRIIAFRILVASVADGRTSKGDQRQRQRNVAIPSKGPTVSGSAALFIRKYFLLYYRLLRYLPTRYILTSLLARLYLLTG